MARFEVKQSAKLNLTSYSGLALIGQCCQAAQVDAVIDPCLPVSQGMRTSDVVKSMVGLLSLGKSDFEAIEPFRSDRFFKEALGLSKVPGSVWIRQRLDAKAAELRELTDELSLRLLERTEAPITAHQGYVCADLDTFVMDNSDTRKEAVSRTYQGIDGYTPIALYLGNEGWNIGLELRAGSHHSALETDFFLERTFPRLERLCPKDAHVLWRDDSGFDSARLLFAKAGERDRWMALGRSFDFITKWNPRKQDKEAWVAKAEVAGSFTETRPGKRVPAPLGPTGADGRDCADSPSGQAQEAQDGIAGDHVPGSEVRRTCPPSGTRLWPQLCRSRQGICGVARSLVASGVAMTIARMRSTQLADSSYEEGGGSPWSVTMT